VADTLAAAVRIDKDDASVLVADLKGTLKLEQICRLHRRHSAGGFRTLYSRRADARSARKVGHRPPQGRARHTNLPASYHPAQKVSDINLPCNRTGYVCHRRQIFMHESLSSVGDGAYIGVEFDSQRSARLG